MSPTAFMSIGKLSGWQKARAAAAHNLRELRAGPDEHVDPARTRLNYALVGPCTADAVLQHARQRMIDMGIDTTRTRKNGVTGIEVLYSLPVGTLVPHQLFFEMCVELTGHRFGGSDNIVSAVVHMDEAAHHCHVILVPILDGRMRGSDMVGGKEELAAHQKAFFETVAAKFGFARPVALTANQKEAMAKAVVQRLRKDSDPAFRSAVWPNIRKAIEANPALFGEALGITPEPVTKKLRTLTQTMISPGKGPKREPEPAFPIGGGTKPYRASEPSLSCVGNAAAHAQPNRKFRPFVLPPGLRVQQDTPKAGSVAALAATSGIDGSHPRVPRFTAGATIVRAFKLPGGKVASAGAAG